MNAVPRKWACPFGGTTWMKPRPLGDGRPRAAKGHPVVPCLTNETGRLHNEFFEIHHRPNPGPDFDGRGHPLNNSTHLPLPDFFSRANRSAVRFFAAARDAFLARAERSALVMPSADFLPPSFPYFRPTALRYSRTSGGIFAIPLAYT